jgi:hypothetical protein
VGNCRFLCKLSVGNRTGSASKAAIPHIVRERGRLSDCDRRYSGLTKFGAFGRRPVSPEVRFAKRERPET